MHASPTADGSPPGISARGPRVFIRGPRLAGVCPASLRRTALIALQRVAPHVFGELGIGLVNDRQIQDLNRRYRFKDNSTDVLSFLLGAGQTQDEPFGDVIISYETARRQARAYRAPLQRELQRLLIHGTLHLCGYDHLERAAAARMRALTRRLLQVVRDV